MTNNFPRVTAILSRIPDAATRWPGWFEARCVICGRHDYSDHEEAFCYKHDADGITYRFCPATDDDGPGAWHGNDIDPRNMHHLWEMLRAVCDNPEIDMAQVSHWIAGKRFAYHYNPNIIEAMLRCLEAAVGVEVDVK